MEELFVGFEPYSLSGVTITDKELGTGAYATVLQMDYLGLKCAGKKIHSVLLGHQFETSYTVQRFTDECHILSQVRHPNIVQFLGVHFHQGAHVPILVMEYLPHTLTQCLNKYDLQENTSYSILHDVALGLNYLHNQPSPIVHRDLSSNNVLLTFNMTAKISDLGVARILDLSPKFSPMTQTPGTPAFMPPEVMVAKPVYDTSVDIFSYGVLMIHALSGKWPEPQLGPNRTEGGKLIPVSEAERREKFLQVIGSDHPLMDLILSCIDNGPTARPQVSDIVTHLAKMVELCPRTFASQLHMTEYIKKLETANRALEEENIHLKGAHELFLLQKRQENLLQIQRKQDSDRKVMNRLCDMVEEEMEKLKSKLMEEAKRATECTVETGWSDFHEESVTEEATQDHQITIQHKPIVAKVQKSYGERLYVNTARPRRASEGDTQRCVKSPPSDTVHPLVMHGLKKHKGVRQRSFDLTDTDKPVDLDNLQPKRQKSLEEESVSGELRPKIKPRKEKATEHRNDGAETSPILAAGNTFEENVLKVHEALKHTKLYSVQRRIKHYRSSSTSSVEKELNIALPPHPRPQSALIGTYVHTESERGTEHNHPLAQKKESELVKVTRKAKVPSEITSHSQEHLSWSQTEAQESPQYEQKEYKFSKSLECPSTRREEADEMTKLRDRTRGFSDLSGAAERVTRTNIKRVPGLKRKGTSSPTVKRSYSSRPAPDDLGETDSIHGSDYVQYPVPTDGKKATATASQYPIYTAISDYITTSPTELSFKKGDQLLILSKVEKRKWRARLDTEKGGEGLVPKSHISALDDEEWFFGKLDASTSKHLLMTSANRSGSFLVRQNKKTGVFSLSVRDEAKARHYHINRNKDGTFYATQMCSFRSIHDMVEHHSQNADGLCHKLSQPCIAPHCIRDNNSVLFAEKKATGQFYEIWKGEWRGDISAIYVIKSNSVTQFNLLDQCARLTTLHHRNLVKFCATYTKSELFLVVTEYMKMGNLKEYLPSKEKELKMEHLIKMSAQVAAGMSYLEKINCIHHDLAAKNVLIEASSDARMPITCKLSIYPYVHRVDISGGVYCLAAGTLPIRWLSHQDIIIKQISVKSNVWSFGVVLWEILDYCRNYPYPEMSELGVMKELKQGYRMPRPLGCPGELYQLMTDCWKEEANARPTFETLHQMLDDFYSSNEVGYDQIHFKS